MNGRDLYGAIYSGERFDRIPISGIGAWAETMERWRREGLGADEDPNTTLDLIRDERASLPQNLNMFPLFEIEVISKNDDYVVLNDEFGVTKRMLRVDFDRSDGLKSAAGTSSSMSQWLDFPVKDMASWKRIFAERFCPKPDGRIREDWRNRRDGFRVRSEARWVGHFCFPFGGLFSAVRELMGLEGTIYAMADDPDLVRTIVGDLSSFYLETFALMLPEFRLDQVTCLEDMCSNRAPLISPAMFRTFFAPGYRKYIM